jgi:hypothetical protein
MAVGAADGLAVGVYDVAADVGSSVGSCVGAKVGGVPVGTVEGLRLGFVSTKPSSVGDAEGLLSGTGGMVGAIVG